MTIARQSLWIGPFLTIIAGCTSPSERFVAAYKMRPAKVESVLAAMHPGLEQSFKVGPPFTLTELRGLDAAAQRGAEGKDAAILWESEVGMRYRDNRLQTEQALRAEVAAYSDHMLDDILALIVPKARNSRWRGVPKTGLIGWDFSATETARAAHIKAICDSLASTPARWADLYPERAPFTFERFGIDRKLLESWCVIRP